ncbi:DUF4189 domain-containing protein [Xanthomonas campestris]|uniref:DUF4189 domain-containing protein n=1 Tax=Xanthomonas campestris TaxID=339 RepID=UPI002366794F|nr:DUF4189 domain-containing protein [Xanthomonas campestris]MEA9710818.1 DUF4189 domain-containing protein [Xanthomonas campestris]MEA9781836.1 DUF4189 domain-containing protein [Xanthomonas campestris pv. raphani]MEA9790384.1 DUF4189 domain-containing protein [Xanthomonas campestris pv. raphani]MEA9802134.1 DUF4189 domain-containing protein [Xanthomonas campestris pv. raphani]MEA9818521.1 DUF4189 domain-containing protein [Xanthomonas campestris pv. raphani]
MNRSRLFLMVNMFLSGVAYGQTACPVGVAPGSPQCGPDSGTSRGDIPDPPPRPTGEWLKTWGAIAGSNSTGETGAVTGKLSRQEAEKRAIQLCAEGGAPDCKINLTYKNQCAVSVSSEKKSFFQGAESKEVATNLAMKDCESYGGGKCNIIYSGCSDPIFKKY